MSFESLCALAPAKINWGSSSVRRALTDVTSW
jgi:hypothetical protein